MNDYEYDYPTWRYRKEVHCPRCGRKGAVHVQPRRRTIIEHHCPGLWTFARCEDAPGVDYGTYRAIFHDLREEDIKRAGWLLGKT